VLADVCSCVGLVLLHDPATYSDRICHPFGPLCEFVKAGTSPMLNSVCKSTKRTLATHPSWRKSEVVRVNSPTAKTLSPQSAGKSRKSLAFGGQSSAIPLSSTQKEDEMFSNLNMEVKVVHMIPSGTVTTRTPRNEPAKSLVKNIACENWGDLMLSLNTKSLSQ